MNIPQELYPEGLLFRLVNLDWAGVLDLGVIFITFYLIFRFVQRSQVASLIRGTVFLAAVLLLVIFLLPSLSAFRWLLFSILVIMLIASPIIFQPELRRFLERLGRTIGLSQRPDYVSPDTILSNIVRAVENMSANHTGALTVFEGRESLDNIIKTGISVEAEITSELLQAIFYPDNPLHDGAIIIRGDTIDAASCVLPLTQRPLYRNRRLGTRHRAAVGASETSDAMVIVVSEETGTISVASKGQLHSNLDSTGLREYLINFYDPPEESKRSLSATQVLSKLLRILWQRSEEPSLQQIVTNLGVIVFSIVFALGFWTFVSEQINPLAEYTIPAIPLRVVEQPEDMVMLQPLPNTVNIRVRSTSQVESETDNSSFEAVISLADFEPGVHKVEIPVEPLVPFVQILSTRPQAVEFELAEIISRTFDIAIDIREQENLPATFALASQPTVTPRQATVTGPAPLVEQVSQLQTALLLAGATSTIQELRPINAFDNTGREISGVTIEPNQAQVRAIIRRRFNAVEVGVRTVTTGTLPNGYWLSGINVSPNNVTLRGSVQSLAETTSFINTLPVDISQSTGDFTTETLLDLPENVQAINDEGQSIHMVALLVKITPLNSDIVLSRPVELINARSGLTVTIQPPEVDLLISGPVPILDRIRQEPELVRVLVNVEDIAPLESVDYTPELILPEEVRSRLVPPTVQVDVAE